MKQIIFVTGSMGRGGAERVISLLSENYVERGWQVSIVMLLHNIVEYNLALGVEVLDFSNDRTNAVLDMPRLIWKLRKFVKKRKPDAVVCFMAPNCLITGLACQGLKTRVVLSERNDPQAASKGKLFDRLRNYVYAKSDITIMQTKRAMRCFPENVQRNSVIIPNPVTVKCEAEEKKRKRIVTVGRLVTQKNQRMLVDAFGSFYRTHPEYILDIYGEGPLRNELQTRIDSLGLTDAITLRGNVSDIHNQIADAELFVLPSNYEGLSNALLEAMMMGLPCISTNYPGVEELIRNDENGLLVPCGDDTALAEAIIKLIADSAFMERLAQKAKETAEDYRVEVVIDLWRKVIEQ